MGRVRLTLAILITVVGVGGLLVCAITQDRWLGVLDLTFIDRGTNGYSTEHIRAIHDGIYFDIEFHNEWEAPYRRPRRTPQGGMLHQRGGVAPSGKTLPTYWGFSRDRIGGDEWMANRCDSTTQWSFPLWPIFLIGLLPIPIMAVRAIPKRRAARLGLCVHCNYNLTGNRSGVCPECGLPIELTLAKSI